MAMQPVVRIREAAARVGVSESTIRKYERAGLIPKAERNRAGQRVYEPAAIEAIRHVIVPSGGGDGRGASSTHSCGVGSPT